MSTSIGCIIFSFNGSYLDISIIRIAKAGSIVVFQGDYCRIYNHNKERIGEIRERNGLYC